MATANDLITAAMRLVGVAEGAAALSAEDAQIGLDALNQMLESWSTQNLAVYTPVSATYNLAAGTASYTIGTAGTFAGVRPIQIQEMYVRYNSIDYPITQITNADYDAIPLKSQQGPFPFVFTYDAGYPLGTITFWMVPNQVLPIYFTANQQLTQLALLSTVLALPPGYFRALKYNLALDLCAEYNKDTPPGVEKIAIKSFADIKRANMLPQTIGVDAGLLGLQGGAGSIGSYYANFIAGTW